MSKSTSDEGEGGDALIHLRVPSALKGPWVRESRAVGMRLTDWVVNAVEAYMQSQITAAVIPDGVQFSDLRLARDQPPAGAGMTPAEFRAWQAHMGLTVRATAELLGVAPSTVQAYRTGTSRATGRAVAVPHVVALACAALAAGLGSWSQLVGQ